MLQRLKVFRFAVPAAAVLFLTLPAFGQGAAPTKNPVEEPEAKLSAEPGATNVAIDTCWVLVTAALVFFMQAGFGMVEAGFIRAKHTTNILATPRFTD